MADEPPSATASKADISETEEEEEVEESEAEEEETKAKPSISPSEATVRASQATVTESEAEIKPSASEIDEGKEAQQRVSLASTKVPGSKKKEKKLKKKVLKQFWDWDWRKTKALAEGKDVDDEEAELGDKAIDDDDNEYAYPLTSVSEILPKEMEDEMKDIVAAAVDRFAESDMGKACAYVKQEFDRKYEPLWHCVMGRSFGFDVTYDNSNILFMFYNGDIGAVAWKMIVY